MPHSFRPMGIIFAICVLIVGSVLVLVLSSSSTTADAENTHPLESDIDGSLDDESVSAKHKTRGAKQLNRRVNLDSPANANMDVASSTRVASAADLPSVDDRELGSNARQVDTEGRHEMTEEETKQAIERERQFFYSLEQKFEEESEDNAWARGVRDKVFKSYNDSDLRGFADLESVECRTTRCIYSLRYKNQESVQDDFRKVIDWVSRAQRCEMHAPGHVLLDRDSQGNSLQRIYTICRR